jgi:hypothetical protein
MGAFEASEAHRRRTRRGAPNVSVSMSSLTAAYTLPLLASAAHCASASQGASTTGMPIRRSSFLQSSTYSGVMRTVRLEKRSMSSSLPASCAAARSAMAFSFAALRFASSPPLSVGGFPSKTYTGLMPASKNFSVRYHRPCRCDVTSPASLVSCCEGPWPSPPERTATRNW